MDNKILSEYKNSIGKEIINSPSPVANWLKGVLKEAEEGSLVIEFKVRREMTNPMGIVHGGIYSLIIDDVIGATVYALSLDNHFVTVNINVDFFSIVRIGEIIIAKSKVIKQGKNIINVVCCIYNSNNKLLAKGNSNLIKNVSIGKNIL